MMYSLIALAAQAAGAQGQLADSLANAQLRLRRVALEIGLRLVGAQVLDRSDDVLYLDVEEIEEALTGEPGAYGARVRLRREDDERWGAYDAPRRVEPQRRPPPA